MQSLLRWSIENSTPSGNSSGNQQSQLLDPGVIDQILGRPDAELMKENVAIAIDSSRLEDERVDALDQLELIIEQIDNANDLGKMNLWEPLHNLLSIDCSTPTIQIHVLWVIGTATQNNPTAQDAYFKLHPLPAVISFLTPSPNYGSEMRSKAIYALSGILKHNSLAVKELGSPDVDGWSKLRDSLQDQEISVRRKAVFLLGTLLMPTAPIFAPQTPFSNLHDPSASSDGQPENVVHDNSHAIHLKDPSRSATWLLTLTAFRDQGLLVAVITGLTNPIPFGEDGDIQGPDPDFEEKCMRLIHTYVVCANGKLFQQEKADLQRFIESEKVGEQEIADKWNLDVLELRDLVSQLSTN